VVIATSVGVHYLLHSLSTAKRAVIETGTLKPVLREGQRESKAAALQEEEDPLVQQRLPVVDALVDDLKGGAPDTIQKDIESTNNIV